MKVEYEKDKSPRSSDGDPTTVTSKEARQGPLGQPVAIILAVSLALAVGAYFLSMYLA